MGLLAELMGVAAPRAASPGPLDDFWYQPLGASSPTWAGTRVGADTAMTIDAVWACVSLLSQTMASLPLPIYERVADDRRRRATEHPLYGLLNRTPNRVQTAMDFRQFLAVSVLLRGGGYARIEADPAGEPVALWPIHPDRVTVQTTGGQRALRYEVVTGGTTEILSDSEVFHLRGLSLDGVRGVSVIEAARQTLGLTLATEEHGARWFGNGARPGGILSPKTALGKDELDRLKAAWQQAFQGVGNAHRIAALPMDVSYQAIGLTNEDSQFLETREHQVRSIARWFGVPAHMIGETTKETSWGSGIEQMAIAFVVYGLRSWLVRWEQAIGRDLISDPDRFYAEHVVDGLLRGDFQTRQLGLQTMRQNGVISANEWRRFENWEPIDGDAGDAHWRPLNMTDASAPTPTPSPAGSARAALFVLDAARRVVRRETAALGKAARAHAGDREGWRQAVAEFCDGDHGQIVAESLRVSATHARQYMRSLRDALDVGVGALEDTAEREARLYEMAMTNAA